MGLALALLAPICVQCTSPTSKDPLVRFESCEELQAFLEERLLHPQNTSSGVVGCVAAEALNRLPGAEGEGEGRTFTTTNTQEADVDEPDFVKNNGEHIFVLRRGRMIVVDAWPPEEARVVSETAIEGVPFTMFFDGEGRAMVFSRVQGNLGLATLVSLFDVTDRAAPVLRREVRIDADYVDARRVGADVVLISRSQVSTEAPLLTDSFRDGENRERLRRAGLQGMLPAISDRQVGDDDETRSTDLAVTCQNTWAPRHTPSTALLLAHTISIADERQPVTNTSVVGTPGSVYASTQNLYLIGTEVYDGGHFTPDFAVTRIHKLGAFDAGAAPYLGSVVIEGVVKDELSVDEDEESGTLRVVVTKNDDNNNDPAANATSLVVFAESDDAGAPELVEVGRADDIGRGEVVESVRFIGERAYVVTFPSTEAAFAFNDNGLPRIPFTDPLFVVDLQDPRAPLLRGVLEVDGYSAYIHPLDATHVLTVGVNVDESGRFTGLQLSIFDVGDADAPTLLHRTSFGDEDSGSEALVERHAFTYFPELKTLALPWQQLNADEVGQTALVVFHVDVAAGFTLQGLVDQLPLYQQGPEPLRAEEAPCGAVRRSIIMSDPELGPWVYAVSAAGITVAELAEGVPVTRNVAFPEGEICDFTGSPL